jgi:hypothetical protein
MEGNPRLSLPSTEGTHRETDAGADRLAVGQDVDTVDPGSVGPAVPTNHFGVELP